MTSYSYSTIRLYRQCPLACQLKRDGMVEAHETQIMLHGHLAHRIYQVYTEWCVSKRRATDLDAARALSQTALELARTEAERDGKTYPLTDHDLEAVNRDLVEPYLKTHLVDLSAFGGAEMQIALTYGLTHTAWDSDDAWFRAVIDLLEFPEDGVARITDYKTGYNTDVDDLQLEVYAWVVMALYPGVHTVETVVDFVRFNVHTVETYERAPDFERIDTKIREWTRRIEEDNVTAPTPGPHCLTCLYAHACDAKVEPRDGDITTLAEAEKAVENLSLHEARLKREKDALRTWCREHGPVTHNGVCYGQHGVGGPGFDDVEAFMEAAILDEVEDPSQYLAVNGTKARRLMEKGEYPEHLQAVAVNKRSVQFGGRKT